MEGELRRLKKENKQRSAYLCQEDARTMGRIWRRLPLTRMGALDRELLKKDLIGMALETRERGGSLADMARPDERTWCDELAKNYGKTPLWEWILPTLTELSAIWLVSCLIIFGVAPKRVGISAVYILLFFVYNVGIYAIDLFLMPRLSAADSTVENGVKFSCFLAAIAVFVLVRGGGALFYITNYWLHLFFALLLAASYGCYRILMRRQALEKEGRPGIL